jgi:hypothetical protein
MGSAPPALQAISSYGHPFILQLRRVTLAPPGLALIMEHFAGPNLESFLVC